MPTAPDGGSTAAASAHREAAEWSAVAEHARMLDGFDPPATEAAVVRFYDPAADLERRSARWSHRLENHGLVAVLRFAAGLAAAEGAAWEDDARDVAMAALADRRYLVSDRLMHWAVPWLATVSDEDPVAAAAMTRLLTLGDVLRPAPRDSRGEGVHPPGEDSYGPVDVPIDDDFLRSVWSGAVRLRAEGSGAVPEREPSAATYRSWARRWANLAASHPGTAALWLDLADRAGRTADFLGRLEKA